MSEDRGPRKTCGEARSWETVEVAVVIKLAGRDKRLDKKKGYKH